MERKIKKKAVIYGLAAILLASALGALIFNFGAFQLQFLAASPPVSAPHSTLLSTFSSADQLKNFLKSNSRTQGPFSLYGPYDMSMINSQPLFSLQGKGTFAPAEASILGHSGTNVQVSGVDEADTVKTDDIGYMYILSGNVVYILKAYPTSLAGVVAKLTFDGIYPVGIFVSGDRLAVLAWKYETSSVYSGYYVSNAETVVKVFDIQDRAHPLLLRDLSLTGSYFNSRMIGNYLYFVANKAAYLVNETLYLPEINSNGQAKQIAPSDIHYFNGTDDYYQYTTFVAVNMQNATESPVYLTVMLGGTSDMYVSLNNMYVTFRNWNFMPMIYPVNMQTNTTIYRIHLQANNMTCEARGTVPGYEANQYSMDEYDSYFRIQTTTSVNGTNRNNIYVLDMNLSTVGRLENLAPGENFHSARFMGNRAYLVTFNKTDPLFVIDLSQPTKPSVLGELRIPGYSDYLYPYDETHLIGVGKETVAAEEGYFAWYQGIKISLFDVSNVSNPIQMANVTIGDRGSDSPVCMPTADPKAFFFDKSMNLLAIPVLVAKVDRSQYQGEVPPNVYGTPVWQGAYVFNVTLEHGFVLRGNVTHMEAGIDVRDESYQVKRIGYIENVLYTVSDRKVKLNMLEDLTPITEILLS
jgi:inhibitor of cysteine peptidase